MIVMGLQWSVSMHRLDNRYPNFKKCSNKNMAQLLQSNLVWQSSLCRVRLSQLKRDSSYIVKYQRMDFVFFAVRYYIKIVEYQKRLLMISNHTSQLTPRYIDVRISLLLSQWKSCLKIMISSDLLLWMALDAYMGEYREMQERHCISFQ